MHRPGNTVVKQFCEQAVGERKLADMVAKMVQLFSEQKPVDQEDANALAEIAHQIRLANRLEEKLMAFKTSLGKEMEEFSVLGGGAGAA